MQIKIKDEKKVKELARRFSSNPTTFINDLIDGLTFPPSFKNEARKHSFKIALNRSLWGSRYAQMLEEEIYEILGKYDYHIEDGEINLKKNDFWFRMYVGSDEKKIDMDSVHIQIESGSALVSVERTLDEVSDFENLTDAIDVANEELGNHFVDARNVEFQFHDIVLDDEITFEVTIEDENHAYLPKLDEINDVLDKLEYGIRKAIK